jgi:hypothetical protein
MDRRGGRDIQRNIAKLPLMERTGWWFKVNRILSNMNHHPVCAIKGSFAFSLYWRSHPSCPGGAMRHLIQSDARITV